MRRKNKKTNLSNKSQSLQIGEGIYMSKIKDLNERLSEHEPATLRTGELKLASEEASNPRSPSAMQSQQKHSDKQSYSSHAASNRAHAPVNTMAKPKPQVHVLKPLAPRPLLQPLKPMAPMKPLMPVKPKI